MAQHFAKEVTQLLLGHVFLVAVSPFSNKEIVSVQLCSFLVQHELVIDPALLDGRHLQLLHLRHLWPPKTRQRRQA